MMTRKNFKQNTTRAACAVLASLTLMPNALALTPSYTPSSSYRSGSYYSALQDVRLTGDQRSDIVAVAKSQLNYTEGNSAKQLAGTSGGKENFTEYGNWYGLQDMWCATFVSWCASQAGISTSVVPKHSFTVDGLNFFINKGQAYTRKQVANGTYTPQAGDIVYFKNSRNNNKTNHVGIVTGWSDGTLYTIEGNTKSTGASGNGGGVYAKSYSINDTFIVYICSPAYSGGNSLSSLIQGSITLVDPVDSGCFARCASHHTSLVTALQSVGAQSSYSYRASIAKANNISGYTGSSSQNSKMLSMLKAGTLKRPNGSPSNTIVIPDGSIVTNESTNSNANSNTNSNNSSVASTSYYPRCASGHTSIVSALKSIGVDSSYGHRKSIAVANGISNYSGSSSQNVKMLNLLKAGNLKKPGSSAASSSSSSTSSAYYPRCSSGHTSIVSALKSIGVDSSYSHRKSIAIKNGISNYRGSSSQNMQLLNMLKAGTLKCV